MGALEDRVKALAEVISGILPAVQELPAFLVKRGEEVNKNLVLVAEGLDRLENSIEERLLQLEIRLNHKMKSLEVKLNALKGNSGTSLETLENKANLMELSVSASEKTAGAMEGKLVEHLEILEAKVDHLSAEVSKIKAVSG